MNDTVFRMGVVSCIICEHDKEAIMENPYPKDTAPALWESFNRGWNSAHDMQIEFDEDDAEAFINIMDHRDGDSWSKDMGIFKESLSILVTSYLKAVKNNETE